MSTLMPPIDFKGWIEENREHFKPPVGNKQIWEDADFMAFVIGGPNARKDFHVDPSEEFFYQVEGDMVLEIIEDGERKDIPIKEGEIFLLPSGVPHSPKRPADTIGLVIEHKRPEGENDKLQWYCDDCGALVHEESFYLTDIVEQLREAIEAFWADDEARTCGECGAYLEQP